MPSRHFRPRARGIAARRALLAVVGVCQRRGIPFPHHACIASVLGISAGQVTRHMAVLLDEGVITTRGQGRRIIVERTAA